MAAYAALVSLEHIMNNLQLHPRPPISLHEEQVHLLTQKITFLQEFLEVYNPNLPYCKEADPLENRIARAAYAAEDAIESHIADQFSNDGEKMSPDGLYEALAKVIEEMALIEKEAMEIKQTAGFKNQLHARSTPLDSSRSSSSSIAQKKSMMVGADDLLLEMRSRLTADARDLQTLPIVGMGGSGKTTLALNIYRADLIMEHFDIRSRATISQEYSIREILIQLLTQLIKEFDHKLSEGELGEMLHKHLYGRKFIIVLDDMWSLKAWDEIKRFLPNNKNNSRIVITTRLTIVASELPNSNSLVMKLLDEDDSWGLLSKIVFGEKGCPSGFEEIGKKIGKSCKGLPLSIVVVGALLAKSKQTIESWEHMEDNLNAIVNLENDEHCLKTLYMSYKQLPVHLKPCFLYMGIYREDHVIRISDLIRLWVAEGFLKQVSGKSLEDVARTHLQDLIDRNLILIHKLGSIGSIKECKVHDLLRDLCLREAKKEGFYNVYPGDEIEDRVSRIVMSGTMPEIEEIDASLSARFLILDLYKENLPPAIYSRLRIVGPQINWDDSKENVHQLVNSRFLTFIGTNIELPSIIGQFWNLKILIVKDYRKGIIVPADISYMSHIRHLHFDDYLYLPNPPTDKDDIVLANLQTLGKVRNFTCSEQMVKRIPNIIKLKISYDKHVDERFCLTNLDCLDKLESLTCYLKRMKCLINFPQSLKKLTLTVSTSQCLQNILDKVGALPLLQKLKLCDGTFNGHWETAEGQFRSLKLLSLEWCKGLQAWTSEGSHFPRLEHLYLYQLFDLEEIPSDFAEILTLRAIDVEYCGDSVIESAKKILEEQQALYGEEETIQVQVKLSVINDPALKSLRIPNFHVT